MNTYNITIKDNSIPPHLLQPNAITEYTATIDGDTDIEVLNRIIRYLESMAIELDTDPESLEILSIIKQ